MTLDEIKKEKELLIQKRDTRYEEVRDLQNKIHELEEQEKELDDAFVKIICPECDSYGYVVQKEGKTICQLCFGNGYIWVKKYKG